MGFAHVATGCETCMIHGLFRTDARTRRQMRAVERTCRRKETDSHDPSKNESRVQRLVRAGFRIDCGDEDLGLDSTGDAYLGVRGLG